MKVFGGMDTQLQPSIGNVSAELTDAFIHFGGVFGLIDIAKEILAILFETHFFVAEEYLSGGLRLAEEVVDIDADEDANLADVFQFLA